MLDMLSKLGGVEALGIKNGLKKINRSGADLSFSDVLKTRLERDAGLKFSAHAVERLHERGITLEGNELARLSGAVAQAEEKGATDSLILIDDKAFIVSIRNRTVVTAMIGDTITNNVFTNIDSTVLA